MEARTTNKVTQPGSHVRDGLLEVHSGSSLSDAAASRQATSPHRGSVCFLAPAASIHTQRWVHALRDRGWNITVLSLTEGGISGTKVVHLASGAGFMGKARYALAIPQVRKHILRAKPDIVHAHFLSSYGVLGALSGFRPLVVSCWGSDVYVFPKKSPIHRFIVERAADQFDLLLTQTRTATQAVKRLGVPESKVECFAWGIDTDLFNPVAAPDSLSYLCRSLSIRPGCPVILSARGMLPVYDVESIVEAMPTVLAERPDTILLLLRGFGTAEYERRIEHKARALHVIDNVRFIRGLVSPPTMKALYCLSRSVISVSLSDDSGVSVAEAMACGAIPIVSDLPAPLELLTHGTNGLVVPRKSPRALAQAIISVLSLSDRETGCMSMRNVELVRRTRSWPASIERMEGVYNRLLIDAPQHSHHSSNDGTAPY